MPKLPGFKFQEHVDHCTLLPSGSKKRLQVTLALQSSERCSFGIQLKQRPNVIISAYANDVLDVLALLMLVSS